MGLLAICEGLVWGHLLESPEVSQSRVAPKSSAAILVAERFWKQPVNVVEQG